MNPLKPIDRMDDNHYIILYTSQAEWSMPEVLFEQQIHLFWSVQLKKRIQYKTHQNSVSRLKVQDAHLRPDVRLQQKLPYLRIFILFFKKTSFGGVQSMGVLPNHPFCRFSMFHGGFLSHDKNPGTYHPFKIMSIGCSLINHPAMGLSSISKGVFHDIPQTVNYQCAIENGHRHSWLIPMKNMVIFHFHTENHHARWCPPQL